MAEKSKDVLTEESGKEEEKKNDSPDGKAKEENNEEIGSFFSFHFIFFGLLSFSDIDLNDPEVEAAAAKIQSVFKMRGKKTPMSKK